MSYVGDPDDPGRLRQTWSFKPSSCSQKVTLSSFLTVNMSAAPCKPDLLHVWYHSRVLPLCIFLQRCYTKTRRFLCSRKFLCSVCSLKLYKRPRYGFPLSLVKHLQHRRSCLLLGKLCQTTMVIPHSLSVIALSGQTHCSGQSLTAPSFSLFL